MVLAQQDYLMHSRAGPSLEGKTILVVDDDKLILCLLCDTLRKRMRGCTILAVENGKEAVDILDAHQVSLVLTDLKMPEMDGYQLLAYIKENYPFVPVFVMTAENSPEVVTRLLSLGAMCCIEKPFDFQDLLKEISSVLAASPGNRNTVPEKQYSI
jgi:CheY-like chemotaxis protein